MEIMQTIDEVFQAAQSGDAQRLKLLLEANPGLASEENRDGLTPLGYAAHFGNQAGANGYPPRLAGRGAGKLRTRLHTAGEGRAARS